MTLKYRIYVDGEVRVEKTFEFPDDVYRVVENLAFDLPEGVSEKTYRIVVEACADNVYCVKSREIEVVVKKTVPSPPEIPSVESISLELLSASRVYEGEEIPLRVKIRLEKPTPRDFRDVLYIMADGEIVKSIDVSFYSGEQEKTIPVTIRLYTGGVREKTYYVYAKFMNVESNRIAITVVAKEIPSVERVELVLYKSEVKPREEIPAIVVIELEDATPIPFEDVLAIFADTTLIYTETVKFNEGDKIKTVRLTFKAPDEPGDYKLFAKFRGITSPEVTLKVVEVPPPRPTKPSIETIVIEHAPVEAYPGDVINLTFTVYLSEETKQSEYYVGYIELDGHKRDLVITIPSGHKSYTFTKDFVIPKEVTPDRTYCLSVCLENVCSRCWEIKIKKPGIVPAIPRIRLLELLKKLIERIRERIREIVGKGGT